MQHHGFSRPTQGIDLLVDPAPDHVERVRQALCVLEDRAVLDVAPTDVETCSVVRVADEVVVDLLGKACGVTYADIEDRIEFDEGSGTPIPFPAPEDLLRMKRTTRTQDAMDRAFLERLVGERT